MFLYTVVAWCVLCGVSFAVGDLYAWDWLENAGKGGRRLFKWATITNNGYQVIVHFLVAYTFAFGGGLIDELSIQSWCKFTVLNILDIFGWWMYFAIRGRAEPLENVLSSAHCGAAVVSIINWTVFKQHYVDTTGKFGDSLLFILWNTGRVLFVLTDAVVRIIGIRKIMSD